METLKLELELDLDPIQGRITREATGASEPFVGWVELAASLERLRAEARQPADHSSA
jgi:hypothetical protein